MIDRYRLFQLRQVANDLENLSWFDSAPALEFPAHDEKEVPPLSPDELAHLVSCAERFMSNDATEDAFSERFKSTTESLFVATRLLSSAKDALTKISFEGEASFYGRRKDWLRKVDLFLKSQGLRVRDDE